ncbi:MAG: hypothetical protein ABJB01_02000 [Rudaea sp.]
MFPGPFPGSVSGQQLSGNLPTNTYMSMQFKITPEYAAVFQPGDYYKFSQGLSEFGAAESFSISTSCGDFSNPAAYASSTVVQNCWKTGLHAGGGIAWFIVPKFGECNLSPGVTYYWNIINANATGVTPTGGTASSTLNAPGSTCSQATCRVGIEDGPEGFQGH